MTDTKSTTRAPECTSTSTSTKPKRRQVEHLFWAKDMVFSKQTGITIPTLCGALWEATGGPGRPMNTVGGLMAAPDPDDCKRCVRVLEVRLRRSPR